MLYVCDGLSNWLENDKCYGELSLVGNLSVLHFVEIEKRSIMVATILFVGNNHLN